MWGATFALLSNESAAFSARYVCGTNFGSSTLASWWFEYRQQHEASSRADESEVIHLKKKKKKKKNEINTNGRRSRGARDDFESLPLVRKVVLFRGRRASPSLLMRKKRDL